MQVPGHRPPGCLAPRVPLPSRLFQGPQSSPARQGQGVGTGSRVHTLTGLQDEPLFPPAGGAGLARGPCLCSSPQNRASCGPVPAMLLMATRGKQSPACSGAGSPAPGAAFGTNTGHSQRASPGSPEPSPGPPGPQPQTPPARPEVPLTPAPGSAWTPTPARLSSLAVPWVIGD